MKNCTTKTQRIIIKIVQTIKSRQLTPRHCILNGFKKKDIGIKIKLLCFTKN